MFTLLLGRGAKILIIGRGGYQFDKIFLLEQAYYFLVLSRSHKDATPSSHLAHPAPVTSCVGVLKWKFFPPSWTTWIEKSPDVSAGEVIKGDRNIFPHNIENVQVMWDEALHIYIIESTNIYQRTTSKLSSVPSAMEVEDVSFALAQAIKALLSLQQLLGDSMPQQLLFSCSPVEETKLQSSSLLDFRTPACSTYHPLTSPSLHQLNFLMLALSGVSCAAQALEFAPVLYIKNQDAPR